LKRRTGRLIARGAPPLAHELVERRHELVFSPTHPFARIHLRKPRRAPLPFV
jgi:hypothetical protein